MLDRDGAGPEHGRLIRAGVHMLRRVAGWVLKLVTCTIPVFIAACYGVPYRFRPCPGKVVDKTTQVGIPGIEVRCRRGGDFVNVTSTSPDGSFILDVPEEGCDSIDASDVDGTANGSYLDGSLQPVPPACDVTIELEPT